MLKSFVIFECILLLFDQCRMTCLVIEFPNYLVNPRRQWADIYVKHRGLALPIEYFLSQMIPKGIADGRGLFRRYYLPKLGGWVGPSLKR